jgi:hypothetical protein
MGPLAKRVNKIQTAEMRLLRKVKGCTRLDRIRNNEDIRAELNIYSINERLQIIETDGKTTSIEWKTTDC